MTGPNLPHMWVTDASGQDERNHEDRIIGRDLVLQFNATFVDKCVAEFADCSGLTTLLEASRAGVEFSVPAAEHAARAMHDLLNASGLHRLSLFFNLLKTLERDEKRKSLSLQGPDYECTQPKRLDSVLVFIATNFNRADLSCREIAEREGMGLSAFSRFFERHVKCTCLEYVNRLRIYKACQLLLETDDRVTSICFDVGYDTLSTFNRNFTRLVGTSPSAFRMERRAAPVMSDIKQYNEGETENVSWN
jgi:AraC-like DNA-binding protein